MASIFSGREGRLTAMMNARMLQDAQRQIDQRLNFGQDAGIGAIQGAQPMSLAALGQGYDQARGQYGGASAMFQPYSDTGGRAFNLLADSYGVNGAEGNQAAVGAFLASPDYQWNVDQATDATARRAAALGTAGGGNTMAAISDRAGQMANQEYGNWRAGLKDLGQTGFASTSAQAGLSKGIGDLYAGQGTGLADIYRGDASRIAGIYGNTASAGANAIGNTVAGVVNQNTLGQQAGQNASANQWNLGMNLLGLGSSLAGRYFGGGGLR